MSQVTVKMSDNDEADSEKEDRSASKSASPQRSVKSANRPPAHSHARSVRPFSLHSRFRTKPLCRRQSHSCYRSCRHISNRTKLSKGLNSCLGVFGLSTNTTEKNLKEVFSQYGPLSDVCLVWNRRLKHCMGYSFVYFEKIDDAIEAKERANGLELNGCKIRVDYSATNRPRSPTSGINMGQRTFGRGGSRGPTCDSRWCDRGYDRGYHRNDDRGYNKSYRKRSPSPYHRGAYRFRSRSHSPRKSSPQRHDGRGYDRGYNPNDDREYNRSYRKRSPSPYHRGAYRSRSRSHFPHKFSSQRHDGRGYDRGYNPNDDREYNRSYRKRYPSPYHRGAYRSRSRSHFPHKFSSQRYY